MGNIVLALILSFIYLAIGIVKATLWVVPAIIVLEVCYILISLIWIWPNLFFTYRAIWMTTRIGPNLKILGCAMGWIFFLVLLALVPVATPIATFLVYFFGCIGYTVFSTARYLNDKDDLLTQWGCCSKRSIWIVGYYEIVEMKAIGRFWKFMSKSYQEYLDNGWVNHAGNTFDIRILDTMVGIFFSLLAMCIHPLFVIVTAVAFYIPHIISAYYWLFSTYFHTDCTIMLIFFIPLLVAIPCVIPVYTLASVLFILASTFSGIYLGVMMYKKGFTNAFKADWKLYTRFLGYAVVPIKAIGK